MNGCKHLPGRCRSCDRQACLNCRARIEPELTWEKTTYIIGDCLVCHPPGAALRALVADFIELGPRPDRQYCEPTDEDQAIWEAWDSRFVALISRARELGVVVEPVAKE